MRTKWEIQYEETVKSEVRKWKWNEKGEMKQWVRWESEWDEKVSEKRKRESEWGERRWKKWKQDKDTGMFRRILHSSKEITVRGRISKYQKYLCRWCDCVHYLRIQCYLYSPTFIFYLCELNERRERQEKRRNERERREKRERIENYS
jgi:hypothetical protein